MRRALMFLAFAVAGSVRGENDILPRPPRRGGNGHELAALIRDTRVGGPQHYRHLVVYPLFTEGLARMDYLTLDQALGKGWLVITEKGEGSVPELLVENRADEPVFLLAGEIVRGGKQNRVISQDVLLAPRSGPISLGVFCVEEGRWTMESGRFAGEREMAHSNLRQTLSAPAVAQERVWGEVARKAEAVAPEAGGGSKYVGRVYAADEVQRDVAEYTKGIVLPRGANGMAVVIGGRVVGAELFGDAGLFAKLRDKLLRSYALDAIECKFGRRALQDGRMVERFLQRAATARLMAEQSVGVGRYFKIQGGGLYGSVLTWHEQDGAHGVVHAGLFDEQPVVAPVPIRPQPPIVPWER